ncbi:MAG: PHD finger domain-containing protein [Planctomycetes bacterium]|nr:PHD finger domain-containing protein [Planctomycetota bacterium]
MDVHALTIRVEHPRCPFCHGPVEPDDAAAPCLGCRAWHHSECLAEGAARCGACGRAAASAPARVRVTPRQARAAARAHAWGLVLWLGACASVAAAHGAVLPAFRAMFREVGVSLPAATLAALGVGGWVWAVALLSLLHAAALCPDAPWRERLRAGAVATWVSGVALGVWALFLPLVETIQRL